MWDDVAKQFNKQEIQNLTPTIIIAVSSCRVTKHRDVQLTATPATYYYINPRTPEIEYAYTAFKEKYSLPPPLQISKYRYQDPEQEKMRNRQTLPQQNPISYKGVRFTCEAMITSVRENRDLKYASCSECGKGLTQVNGIYTCEDHGKQDPIRFALSTKKGAGEFVAENILDIETTVETHTTGTPAHDIIEDIAETIVMTIPHQMSETPPVEKDNPAGTTPARLSPAAAKRSLDTDISLEAKKNKGTETFSMEQNNIWPELFSAFW
ncbi:replication protein A 70 kDa DNA-binding subunit [Tanacetum coccineum]